MMRCCVYSSPLAAVICDDTPQVRPCRLGVVIHDAYGRCKQPRQSAFPVPFLKLELQINDEKFRR